MKIDKTYAKCWAFLEKHCNVTMLGMIALRLPEDASHSVKVSARKKVIKAMSKEGSKKTDLYAKRLNEALNPFIWLVDDETLLQIEKEKAILTKKGETEKK